MTLGNNPVLFKQLPVSRTVIGNNYFIRNAKHQPLKMQVLDQSCAVPVKYGNEYGQ